MWTQARLTAYIGAAFAGAAFLAASMGLATYDTASGMVDFKPFNVWLLAGVIAGPVSSAIAALAVALGWGRK